ncbi:hypothetical protein [Methanosarcina barkeri]|uniref:hypothetical protein n=1 Tax=Methanosarcina barkeri TaxID=2208 RepID=UPI0006D0BCFE|nr:hypothetical protein [Methanosarcina barkeri]
MLRDEHGVLEPHTDLLSVALAVIGFMVFAALMSQTYLGYEDRSFALENYETASLIAENLADDPVLGAESSGLLSAASLDTLSGRMGLMKEQRFLQLFPGITSFWLKSEQETVSGTGRSNRTMSRLMLLPTTWKKLQPLCPLLLN